MSLVFFSGNFCSNVPVSPLSPFAAPTLGVPQHSLMVGTPILGIPPPPPVFGVPQMQLPPRVPPPPPLQLNELHSSPHTLIASASRTSCPVPLVPHPSLLGHYEHALLSRLPGEAGLLGPLPGSQYLLAGETHGTHPVSRRMMSGALLSQNGLNRLDFGARRNAQPLNPDGSPSPVGSSSIGGYGGTGTPPRFYSTSDGRIVRYPDGKSFLIAFKAEFIISIFRYIYKSQSS